MMLTQRKRKSIRRARIGRWGCLIASLVLCILPQRIGRADYAPHGPPVEAPHRSVSVVFDAVSRCRPTLPERDRWRIAGVIHHESQSHGYDPLFVVAMIEVESACRPSARSPRGAIGLIQVKPSTVRSIAADAGLRWRGASTLVVPAFNIQLGLRYLRQLEEQFRDPRIAVAAYNLGPARVARMSPRHARRTSYVRSVLARYEVLLARHAAHG
jgi:soluble lytic murein transglycosylase-like protein